MPPFDGTPPDPPPMPLTMACLVMGGCADGAFLRSVEVGADRIELKRPLYKKPLASAVQKIPEIANESDEYKVHPFVFESEREGTVTMMGLAVVAGRSLEWAMRQLLVSYVEKAAAEQRAAGLNLPTTPNPNKP